MRSVMSLTVLGAFALAPLALAAPKADDLKQHKDEVADRIPVARGRTAPPPSEPSLAVGGLVRTPLLLTVKSLRRLARAPGESDRSSRAADAGPSVPLQALVELAGVRDEEGGGTSDIALVVKSRGGEQVALAWSDVTSAPEDRYLVEGAGEAGGTGLPALTVRRSGAGPRTWKDVGSVDVVRIPGSGAAPEAQDPRVVDGSSTWALSQVLERCRSITVPPTDRGERRGGPSRSVTGVSLKELFDRLPAALDSTDVVAFTSSAGRRVAISSLALEDPAHPVLVAPGGERGSYDLVFTEAGADGRGLRGVRQIRRVSLRQRPTIYVVGVGCGDADLLTSEAVSIMGRADAFICMEKFRHTLAGYMGGKPVLFDPFLQLPKFYRRNHPELSQAQAEEAVKDVIRRDMQMIREALDAGKTVALLEPGDPTLFGGWRNWLSPYFSGDAVKVVPGMSAFNVGNAMLGEYDLTARSVIITEPENLAGDDSVIEATARNRGVMVIFMGLSRMKKLVPLFRKHFAETTPVHLVYDAGIAGRARRVKTTLGAVVQEIGRQEETFLGLVYIGAGLR